MGRLKGASAQELSAGVEDVAHRLLSEGSCRHKGVGWLKDLLHVPCTAVSYGMVHHPVADHPESDPLAVDGQITIGTSRLPDRTNSPCTPHSRRRWDQARPPGSAFRRRLICSPVLGIAAGEGCCREVRSWCCIGVGVSQIHPTRHWCLLFYPTSCWKRKVGTEDNCNISQVEGRPMPRQ